MHNKVYEKVINFIKENLWFFISLIAIILLFNIELPYIIEMPGGYIPLNDRITIEGKDNINSELGMAYVSTLKGNIPFILFSYINPDFDIVSKDKVMYEDETSSEMETRDKLLLNESISNATIAAYSEAGENFNIEKTKIYVAHVINKNSEFKTGDNIIKIDGRVVNDIVDIQNYLKTLTINDTVKLTVIRDNKEIDVKSTLIKEDDRLIMGVTIVNNYEITTNPKVEIKSKRNESGPSGGLMMALTIYDKLTSSNLSKGDKIIGTGTISKDGLVGDIGGVKYKLIGAINNKAKVFLCSKGNYEEVKKIKEERNYDIIIKDVATLSEAIEYLKSR